MNEDGVEGFTGGNDNICREFAQYFHELLVNLSVAKLAYEDFQGAEETKGSASPTAKKHDDIKHLKEICDQIKDKMKAADSAPNLPMAHQHSIDIVELNGEVRVQCGSPVKPGLMMTEETKEVKDLLREQLAEKMRLIKRLLEGHHLGWLIAWETTENFQSWLSGRSPTIYCLSEFVGISLLFTST